MNRHGVMLVAVLTGCLLAAADASSQGKRGPFDGKWTGESARCAPVSNNYRFNNLTITNSSFSWTATDRGRSSTCKVTVKPEGSFQSDQDCAFQLTGKFDGQKLAIRIKTSERDCEIVAKRE